MEVGDLVQLYDTAIATRLSTDAKLVRGVLIEKRFPYNWLLIYADGKIIDCHEAYLEVINESR